MTSNTGHSSDDDGVDFHKAKSREKNEVDEFAEDLSKDEEEEDDETTCGWLGIRPSCIQGCNRSSVFLVFWCGLALFQSTTVNGLVYVVTTTLERRFSLPSAQSGAISSTYDFTVLVLIVFVTYLTERIHKPLLLGGGAIVFALGSYVFTLPHFLAPNHSIGAIEGGEVCHVNGTAVKCNEESGGSLSGFYWYFVAGQVLHGIGSCPIYTHGRIYIYENVRAQVVPIYFAILQLLSSLGIAVGFLFGGVLLQMYTDLQTDVSTLEIDPSSPIWIGNWWIGFIIVGTLSLLISIPLAGFPKYIKGTSAIRKANDEFTRPQKGSEFYATRGVSGLVKDFPRAMWNLIKNIPLMCINFGIAAEFFIISCTTVFGPKYMETQFNLQASTAAVMAGAIVVPSSIIGVLLGGWIIKKFNLQYTGQARLCCVALLASLILLVAFLIGCPNVDFAGVTAPYDNGGSELGQDVVMNITDSCNKHCQCIDSFAPVCGSNDVMYYSACHAGCSSFEIVNGTKMYVDCECISATSGSPGLRGIANPGRCSLDDCFRPYIFFGLTLFLVICSSMVLVPSQTMLLGVVSPSQRTTATGLGSLMFRAFGSVPGPIILGTIIDNVCLVWEYDCDGGKTCWMYENKSLKKVQFTTSGKMDLEKLPLIGQRRSGHIKHSISMFFISWILGLIEWSNPKPDTNPLVRSHAIFGNSRCWRNCTCLSSVSFLLLLTMASLSTVLINVACNIGEQHHTLQLVAISVCYWPILILPQILCLVSAMSNLVNRSKSTQQDKQGSTICWKMLFREHQFHGQLQKLNNPGDNQTSTRVLLLFLSLAVMVSAMRISFYLFMQENCKFWLDKVWIFLEVFGLMYTATFAYFLYLQRIFLEAKERYTTSFIEENVGDLENCTLKAKDLLKEYLQLRQIFRPYLNWLLFSSSFGLTSFFALNFVNEYEHSTDVTITTPIPTALNDSWPPFCTQYCTEADFEHNTVSHYFINLLSLSKICNGLFITIAVTKARDLKYVWNGFKMKLNFLYSTASRRDRVFWERLSQFLDQINPSSEFDIIHTVIIPLVGLGTGLLSGKHFLSSQKA